MNETVNANAYEVWYTSDEDMKVVRYVYVCHGLIRYGFNAKNELIEIEDA